METQQRKRNLTTMSLADICLALAAGDLPVEQRGQEYLIRKSDLKSFKQPNTAQPTTELLRQPFLDIRSA